jgi:phosphoglycerol transferase MdoB-like AlkP superfamily enzyme
MKVKALKLLSLRLGLLLMIYSVLRFVFYLKNVELFQAHSVSTLTNSFIHGLRFDLAALAWINTIFLVFALIPHRLEKVERAFFLSINSFFIFTAVTDLELFQFNGKRMSMEFFSSLGMDFSEQVFQVLGYYWYLTIAGILLALFLWWGDKKLASLFKDTRVSWKWRPAILIAGLIFGFIAIRGGLQHKSIQVQSAFIQGANELGHLTLNTPYHFLRTFNAPKIQKKTWFTEVDLQSKLNGLRVKSSYPGYKNHNVILIILESVSLEYSEEGYTPFLKELGEKGIFFNKHFANGRRSIEVLSSILDGIPSVQETPFSKSNAQGMALEGVATRLKAAGYKTAFFHGAARGSMSFDSYALSHGIEQYFGREDYPDYKKDFDGNWGVFDGPFLGFFLEKLRAISGPFFAGIFTISSHHPYTLPKEWQGKFNKGTLEIHESVGYVDQMLREFFAKAEKEAWFKETLFVITADHTQKMASTKFKNALGNYRVPMIIYHPAIKFDKALTSKVTQHVDLPASILDFVDVSEAGLNMAGESIFSNGAGRALHFLQPGWQYVRGDRLVRWVEGEPELEYQWNANTGVLTSMTPSELKSESQLYIQYLLNSFRQNRWPFVVSE